MLKKLSRKVPESNKAFAKTWYLVKAWEVNIATEQHCSSAYRWTELFNSFGPTGQTPNRCFCNLISIHKDSSFSSKAFRILHGRSMEVRRLLYTAGKLLTHEQSLYYLLYHTYFSVLVAWKSFPLCVTWRGCTRFELNTPVCSPCMFPGTNNVTKMIKFLPGDRQLFLWHELLDC